MPPLFLFVLLFAIAVPAYAAQAAPKADPPASPAVAGADRVVDAPPALTGGCRAIGEVLLYPAGLRPASTLAAAGQLVRSDANQRL